MLQAVLFFISALALIFASSRFNSFFFQVCGILWQYIVVVVFSKQQNQLQEFCGILLFAVTTYLWFCKSAFVGFCGGACLLFAKLHKFCGCRFWWQCCSCYCLQTAILQSLSEFWWLALCACGQFCKLQKLSCFVVTAGVCLLPTSLTTVLQNS